MVGCTSCQVWCIYDAISFPDPDNIKNLIKKRGVLKLTKQQLREKLERGENVAEQSNKTPASNEQ